MSSKEANPEDMDDVKNSEVRHSRYQKLKHWFGSFKEPNPEDMDDLNNSEGFYLMPSNGSVRVGRLIRIKNPMAHSFKGKRAAEYAVAKYNEEKGQMGMLKYERIIYINVELGAGETYYITMEVKEDSGRISQYQAKIWEKLDDGGYEVLIFRRAPYCMAFSDRRTPKSLCMLSDLKPWMDESYLYYKCFYRYREELVGIKVIRCECTRRYTATLWLRTRGEGEKILQEYRGKKMPLTNNYYQFESSYDMS
ncbi:hypothetical protein CDL12_08274 [Handroanthus impetiginosus]|uniref:Cystatin domain-containing protein n=1 Tax=Handroanthus impetiginosus TaxID=429701 RepID=A0A2G9HNN6_9LAMI|nr:hypothetical protein CDL12_08274 [Handroanthus impetiginosus]